ncbi:hypothetical protein PMAYCL1PPCAC_03722 [Pristionchus mayeri]|uniref:F-box domain-containing protein n=1 Tax=Pristionchus mayeri TaxID=1317129 RepID=A0AAN5C883_9BILA|nr:hypothetical protein PMAYCL1PPCAC_03722 [Pristionchus mayeri]
MYTSQNALNIDSLPSDIIRKIISNGDDMIESMRLMFKFHYLASSWMTNRITQLINRCSHIGKFEIPVRTDHTYVNFEELRISLGDIKIKELQFNVDRLHDHSARLIIPDAIEIFPASRVIVEFSSLTDFARTDLIGLLISKSLMHATTIELKTTHMQRLDPIRNWDVLANAIGAEGNADVSCRLETEGRYSRVHLSFTARKSSQQ